MAKLKKLNIMMAGFLLLAVINTAYADDVKVVAADFKGRGENLWSVSVTLKHGDTGWDHYADDWRVVDSKGNVLGDRVLHHPHVGEQPFTRSLGRVKIPKEIAVVYIEAHDKEHGWTPNKLKVDLSNVSGGHLRVEAR